MSETETAYLIVLADGVTPVGGEADWVDVWLDEVAACNAIVMDYWPPADHAGQPRERLLEVTYADPDDTAVGGTGHPGGHPLEVPDPLSQAVIRYDVVSEIDATTIAATASVYLDGNQWRHK